MEREYGGDLGLDFFFPAEICSEPIASWKDLLCAALPSRNPQGGAGCLWRSEGHPQCVPVFLTKLRRLALLGTSGATPDMEQLLSVNIQVMHQGWT